MSDSTKKIDYKKTKKFKEVKNSMLSVLSQRGLEEPVYVDKVNEYMDFWARRCELRDDVNTRGLTVIDERGRLSENRSVSLENQTAKLMLSIFTALGFKPEDFNGFGGIDDIEL